MLRLLLLRHAKSKWTEAGTEDRDRPLAGRGRSAAQAMGRVMRDRGLVPDLVLCSPARRARDTWECVVPELRAAPRLLVEEALYDFGNGGRVAEAIRKRGDKARSLLVVGHNPSLERLAARLAGQGEGKLRDRLEKKYPTGALAVFDVNAATWAGFEEETASLTHFIRPRDVQPGEPD
jgi:phosphohistidine phosphatase